MAGQIAVADFRSGFQVNWREAFEQVTGIFLDPGTSMFETLATISADEASKPIGGGCASIAAQVNHTRYHLELMNRLGRGENVGKPDWAASWAIGAVDDAEWQQLIDRLRAAYDEATAFVSGNENWSERMIGGAFGMLAHSAYHLGEIRAGLCVIKGNRGKGA